MRGNMNNRKMIKIIKKIVHILIGYISLLSIRNKKIYLFGSWFGEKFSDNPKYLYLEAIKDKNIKAIWITKNIEVCKYLNSQDYEAYLYNSIKGISYQVRAKYYFICTSLNDVNSYLISGSKLINLWHGIPLKKIMWDDKGSNAYYKKNNIEKFIYKMIKKIMPKYNEYLLSSSPQITKIYTSAFKIKENSIFELGQPRNDVFFDQTLEDKDFPDLYKRKPVVLYMPTHRNEGKIKIESKSLFRLVELDKFCVANNILFLIKKHFYHRNESEELENFKNITNKTYDTQMLLKYADVLITDYSSCYIDYLLLDRPIIFYYYDYNGYLLNDRELYFPYDKVTPGIKVTTFDELFIALQSIIEDKKDEFQEERNEIKDLFYSKENQNLVGPKILDFVKRDLK